MAAVANGPRTPSPAADADDDDFLKLEEEIMKGEAEAFDLPEYLLPKEERERRAAEAEKRAAYRPPERDADGLLKPFSPPPLSEEVKENSVRNNFTHPKQANPH